MVEIGYEGECPCRENGSDGTDSHDKYCGFVYRDKPHYPNSRLKPCANHEKNYAGTGWTREEVSNA